jgi:hypothetical protein
MSALGSWRPQEVERLRLAETSSMPLRNRKPAELDEPRLVGMKGAISAPNLSYAAQYLAYTLPYQRFACSLTATRA